MNNAGKIFVVSGPSGAGKTSLVSSLIDRMGTEYKLSRVITYTSRSKRNSEVDNVDYCFITEEEFRAKIETGFFIEWSQAYNAYYGSARTSLEPLEKGASLIMIMDVPGALHMIKEHKAISIWIAPPDIGALKDRLFSRNTDNDQGFRIKQAQRELSDDSSLSLFNYKVLNKHIQEALADIEIIVKQELMPMYSQADEPKVLT